MKLALCLIVKGDDREAELLSRCLSYVSSFVDGIFITITQPNDNVKKVAESYKANISYFEWCNDFSKARNYNFSQVPKDYNYIFWLDSDDVLRNGTLVRETIENNPMVDCFSMMYLYAFDEHKNPVVVHHKTRIVKNDGCVEWSGALHEDFKSNRSLNTYHIKDIEVLHLTDDERIEIAKQRNVEVAEGQVVNEPNDPRSYWNLGNSLKGAGNNQSALNAFDTFLLLSKSDEEKYIVRLRRAESYWALGDRNKAIDEARYAIGTKPEYPDAYHLLGSLYFEDKQFEQAIRMYKFGLTYKPPVYSIIVFNPRDYDYTPLMNMAKAYFNLSLPTLALECLKACAKIYPDDKSLTGTVEKMEKELEVFNEVTKTIKRLQKYKSDKRLKTELDKLPDELKSHPGVCVLRNTRFIKTESSGKDLVFFCGYTAEEWTPDTAITKGIGGSEEAVIHLSKHLADKGWNVTVYNNCGHKELKFGEVSYKPFWSWNPRDKQDAVVIWRHPRLCDYDINCQNVYIDLHDVIQEGEFNEARLQKISKIFVKSEFHRSLFPKIPDEKFVIVPNGLVVEDFDGEVIRDPKLLINTSSPDRSLASLLKGYEIIKSKVPDVSLKWAYGWNVFDVVHGSDTEIMSWKNAMKKKMEELGVQELGRLGHKEIAKLYKEGSVFAYPTEFAEIDCISARKAQLAGCIPVTTDFAALNTTVQYGIKIHSDKTKDNWSAPYQYNYGLEYGKIEQWSDAVVEILMNPTEREEMSEWAKQFSWENISNKWNENL